LYSRFEEENKKGDNKIEFCMIFNCGLGFWVFCMGWFCVFVGVLCGLIFNDFYMDCLHCVFCMALDFLLVCWFLKLVGLSKIFWETIDFCAFSQNHNIIPCFDAFFFARVW
jgi:hypothetical protein